MPVATAPPASTDAYRRAARRLRCRFANDPARLHRSLKALSSTPAPASNGDRQGARPVANCDSGYAGAPPVRAGSSAGFAEHVAASVRSSSVLRYSHRLQLIRDARRYGISRFEANLVIAAVLGRRRGNVGETVEPPDRSFARGVTAFLVVQGALVLGAWWTLFR